MIVNTYNASCMKEFQTIAIGRQFENNYRLIVFNCSGFNVPVDSITLVHQRSKDVAPYIVETANSDSITWLVTDTDTAYNGTGTAELRITFTNGLAKSVIMRTVVLKSITAGTTIPEPLESWYDAMIDYINEHSVTDDQLAQAIEDYIEEHPITAPVNSVNGKIGDVVLSAADVGALPDSTTIPTKTSQLQNDSGFLSSAVMASADVSPESGDAGETEEAAGEAEEAEAAEEAVDPSLAVLSAEESLPASVSFFAAAETASAAVSSKVFAAFSDSGPLPQPGRKQAVRTIQQSTEARKRFPSALFR